MRRRLLRYPWANTILLSLIAAQLLSGFFGLITGSEDLRWILWLHGIGAYAIVLLLFWKGAVVFDSIQRRRLPNWTRLVFLTMAVLLVATLASGIFWTFAGRRLLFGYSLITFHIGLAVALMVLLVLHIYHMRFIFRVRGATDRRAFLRLAGTAIAGLVVWRAAALAMAVFDLPGRLRRFTGSYETGSFSGQFPVVTWLFDYPPPLDVKNWRLVIDGAVENPLSFTYEQLEETAADKLDVLIDCTGGWYSTQQWQGVSVGRLLGLAGPKNSAQSVSFTAVSGYGRRFSVEEARGHILALRVAGQRLDHGHGFPVRLVAPGHRGFEWVKWLTRITVNETSKILQPPVPLQ